MSVATPPANAGYGVQFNRTGISAADADASKIPTIPVSGASVGTVAAVCDTASASITARLIFFNASALPCGSSVQFTFTCAATADFGTLFLGIPNYDIWRPAAGASAIGIKVDSVSAGHWTIYGSMG
jgi:hypothetical protein